MWRCPLVLSYFGFGLGFGLGLGFGFGFFANRTSLCDEARIDGDKFSGSKPVLCALIHLTLFATTSN